MLVETHKSLIHETPVVVRRGVTIDVLRWMVTVLQVFGVKS